MKILVVCQYYYPEPFRITDICETLTSRGHIVTVLTGLPNYPEGYVLDDYRKKKKRLENINGVRVIRCSEVGRGQSKGRLFLNYLSYAFFSSIKALSMKDKFDVVFIYQLSPVLMAIPAIIYKKRYHKKILLYCLDLWPASLAAGGIRQNSLIHRILLTMSRYIYQSADSIMASSRMFSQYFAVTLGIQTTIQHLPQYAEEDLYNQSIAITPKDKYNFVFAGNIGDMQSVETIIRSANELRDRKDITFHIVGDGSKLDECKLLSETLGLSNVVFHGRQSLGDMPKYYSMADAMLVTLKDNEILSYTLPGKVQSYMAARKPIIGAINGETNLVVNESKCGLCCAAEDFKTLSNIIIEFLNMDQEDRDIMGENSYKYYRDNYDKERFITELENALYDLEGSHV